MEDWDFDVDTSAADCGPDAGAAERPSKETVAGGPAAAGQGAPAASIAAAAASAQWRQQQQKRSFPGVPAPQSALPPPPPPQQQQQPPPAEQRKHSTAGAAPVGWLPAHRMVVPRSAVFYSDSYRHLPGLQQTRESHPQRTHCL